MEGAAVSRDRSAKRKTKRVTYVRPLLLFSDDQVLDLVVSGLGNDFFLHQVGLLGVRPVIDNFLGVCGTDARQSIELFFGGAVDVQEIGGGSRSSRFAGGAGLRVRKGNADAENEDDSDKQDAYGISLHAMFSLK